MLRERSANNGLRQVGETTLALSLTGEADNLPSLGGLIRGAKRGIYRAGKYGVIGFTKNAVLEYATRGLPSMPLAG